MKRLVFCILFLLEISISAAEVVIIDEDTYNSDEMTFNPRQLHVNWTKYLSESEMDQITVELAKQEYQRLKSEGKLNSVSGMLTPESLQNSVVITNAIRREDTLSAEKGGFRQTASSGGNIRCDVMPENPHAGSGPRGRTVVKAKSDGLCSYIHIHGTPPPTMTFDLRMVLVQLSNGSSSVNRTHRRTGLTTRWSPRTAQLWYATCINARYSHFNAVWVFPPEGWIYTGPQPIFMPFTNIQDVSNCP
jgi:hypothetical protein